MCASFVASPLSSALPSPRRPPAEEPLWPFAPAANSTSRESGRQYGDTNHWYQDGLSAFLTQMELIMRVTDVLRIKGSVVKTVPPHETALLLSGHLRAEQIGALVVSTDGNSIDGIVSERDLAYGLATYGSRLPTISISELMTKAVVVCSPEDSVTDVMKLMTRRRIRHVPVKDGDQLVGIISIGDVLKHRLEELQVEADVLRDYAMAARH